ncbi:MAG: hypothetical protein ABI668_05010 [Sphingorhabdus sp.]
MSSPSYLITEIIDVFFDQTGQFVGIRFGSEEQDLISIGLHPEMAHNLATMLFEKRQAAASAGIFQPLEEQGGDVEVIAVPHPAGVGIAMDLGPHKTQLNFQLSRDYARKLGERLIALADRDGNETERAH